MSAELRDILRPAWIKRPEPEEPSPVEEESEIRMVDGQMGYKFLISSVTAESPAAKAGIQKGDVIISLGDSGSSFKEMTLDKSIQSWGGESRTVCVVGADKKERIAMLQPIWNEKDQRWIIGVESRAQEYLMNNGAEEEKQRIRLPIDIQNSNGETVVGGYTVLGPSEKKIGYNGARVIEKYIFFVPQEDGTIQEFNVLKRLNPKNLSVYWAGLDKGSGVYVKGKEEIRINNVLTPLTPHILAHEFRHSYQHEMHSFDDIEEDYISVLDEEYTKDEKWTESFLGLGLEAGIKKIKKILSYIFNEEEVERFLAPSVDKWRELNRQIFETYKEDGVLKKEGHRLDEKHEYVVWSAMHRIFKPAILEFISREQFENAGKNIGNDRNSLAARISALGSVKILYKGKEVNETIVTGGKTSLFSEIEDSFSNIEIYFQRDQYQDTNPAKDFAPPFLWNEAIIDVSRGTVTVPSSDKEVAVMFILQSGKGVEWPAAIEKATREFEEDTRTENEKYGAEKKRLQEKVSAVKEKRDMLQKILPDAQTELCAGVRIIDVLRLPTWLIERDAEYGALVALRAIKEETGIDLVQQFTFKYKPPESSGKKESNSSELSLIKGKIDSLRSIQDYMNLIGVPTNCLRKIPLKRLPKVKKTREEGVVEV